MKKCGKPRYNSYIQDDMNYCCGKDPYYDERFE